MTVPSEPPEHIRSLLPRGLGHQFVVYGDSCSGVPGAPHEQTFAAVNAVVRRLSPSPDFIVFTGDEIAGLTADRQELKAQWRYWLDREIGWLDLAAIPLWHTTGNHTAYDPMSEAVFRDVLGHLPRNGPPGQEGLSYWMRRDDLSWSSYTPSGRVSAARVTSKPIGYEKCCTGTTTHLISS
jgi:hypothetical protein